MLPSADHSSFDHETMTGTLTFLIFNQNLIFWVIDWLKRMGSKNATSKVTGEGYGCSYFSLGQGCPWHFWWRIRSKSARDSYLLLKFFDHICRFPFKFGAGQLVDVKIKTSITCRPRSWRRIMSFFISQHWYGRHAALPMALAFTRETVQHRCETIVKF
jgi:hypothetical protein